MQAIKERMDGFKNDLDALSKKWHVMVSAEIQTTPNSLMAVPVMVDIVPKNIEGKIDGKSPVVKP